MKKYIFVKTTTKIELQKSVRILKLTTLFLLLSMINLFGNIANLAAANAEQQVKITGTITDAKTGEVLPGVNIVLVGTTIGTISDVNGKYSLNISQPNGSLAFSFIGYIPATVVIGNQSVIDVKLDQEVKSIETVVVVGYGTTKKKDITGSVSTLTASEMNKGVYSSPAQMLQGKIPGLNITKSGDPTASPSITLRGPSTLRSGAAMEPFYVIDGVPGALIESVAADDIVSMDVLRDASSTAIFGSRAANGVIMVTTKRAKAGQSYVSYSSYVAVENVSNRIEMLSAAELRAFLKTVNKVPFDDNGGNTNWQDEVMRTGISQNHNLSFGGGSDKTTYGVSMNYLENEGIMKTSSLDRWTARMNVEQKAFNDKVTVGLNLTN
jgi:iron complex outermembrane receptor protein